jgi:hypothetical protein
MRSAALRVVGSGLVAIRNVTLPSPWLSAGAMTSRQASLDDVDHLHSRAIETGIVLVPPSGPKDLAAESKLG